MRRFKAFDRAGCRLAVGLAALALSIGTAAAADVGFSETIKRHTLPTTTAPENGGQNPSAIVVAPVSAGRVTKDDVLVTTFNDSGNLQGPGSTTVHYNPSTKRLSVFAAIARHLPQCPAASG